MFSRFWSVYPKKVAKMDAEKAWKSLAPSAELEDEIVDDVSKRAVSEEWQNRQFIPHAGTYLRGRRWCDERRSVQLEVGSRWYDDCQHQPKCEKRVWHDLKVYKEGQREQSQRVESGTKNDQDPGCGWLPLH